MGSLTEALAPKQPNSQTTKKVPKCKCQKGMLVSSHAYETLQMLSKPKRYLQNLQWNMHFELAENMHSYPCVDIWSCSRWDVIRVDQTRCIVRHSRKGVASDSSMGIAGIGVIGICSTQLQGAPILRCTLGCPLFHWTAGSSQELRGSMASFGHAQKKYMWAALVRFPPRSAIDRDTAYILQTGVPWWQLVRSALNIASKI